MNVTLHREDLVTGCLTKVNAVETSGEPSDTCPQEVSVLQRTLEGWCTLQTLPPPSRNVVRIFVSSTFSDTKEERNAFMEKVYPQLSEMCRRQYGLEFQVMDMRWGVPEQASDNHSTTELCLQEILKCQEVSAGPSFVALLGNKYGYRPIPTQIPLAEFESLETTAMRVRDTRWSTVVEWYKLDKNNLDHVYVLQSISVMIAHYSDNDEPELRKEAQNMWIKVDQILTCCLRDNASRAYECGLITGQEKHRYFMSVTENEIEHGMLKNIRNPKESCLCIIREIPDIASHLQEKKSPKFIDLLPDGVDIDKEAGELIKQLKQNTVKLILPESNLTKVEIEWLASGAAISLEQIQAKQDVTVETFAEKLLKKRLNVSKHKDYIDSLCSEYLEKLTSLISLAGEKKERLYDETSTELLQHWYFARSRCEIFEGRQDVIEEIKHYISSKTTHPLIIYGQSGCGKTSVLAKVVDIVSCRIASKGHPSALPFRLCLRFFGTTPLTCNIQQVLTSVCQQLAAICGMAWEKPDKYSDTIKLFHGLLLKMAQTYKLILVLDSVDQLLPTYKAYSMNWLPDSLPRNVKVIVSTLEEGYPVIEALRRKYCEKQGNGCQFVEIKPLADDTGLLIVEKWLAKAGRTMSCAQKVVIRQALGVSGLPLFARIMFDRVRKWRSHETFSLDQLETTVTGAINKLYIQMENKFGVTIVKHSLSFLTSARYGLSEMELEHIMSLDDELLNVAFTYWKPPIRRIPPLLWTRVRADINSYVVERSADGTLVLYWYHRQFIKATKDRYLQDDPFRRYIHAIMVEYFSGTWGGGRPKPFRYVDSQVVRFGLSSAEASEDRRVPLQPYSIQNSQSGDCRFRYNQRKASELPFHIAQTANFGRLKAETFFNLEWLLAKLYISSFAGVLEEFEIFLSTYDEIKTDRAYRILYSTLQFTKTYVMVYPHSLPYELSGRLARYVKNYTSIRSLIQACDSVGLRVCPLVPLMSCFESAQIGLKQSLSIAKGEPWHDGGAFCFTDDFRIMYVIGYDETGLRAHLSTWDVVEGNEIQRVAVAKPVDGAKLVAVYFNMLVHHAGRHVAVQYRHVRERLDGRERRNAQLGGLDVIEIGSGAVIRSVEHARHNRTYNNSVYYMKGDWIALRFGNKMPLIHLFEAKTQMYGRPHMMTNDCTKLIKICSMRTDNRLQDHDSRTVRKAKINHFDHKKNQGKNFGEFDCSDGISGMTVTNDDQFALLAEAKGHLKLYHLRRLADGKIIKLRRQLSLPQYERVKTLDGLSNDEDSDDSDDADEGGDMLGDVPATNQANQYRMRSEKMSTRLKLIVSPNDRFVISVHQGNNAWEAFVWNFTMAKGFVGRITNPLPLHVRYPEFSYDSQLIVFASEKEITVLSTRDATLVHRYTFKANIKDLYMSHTSNDVAAMIGMEVVVLDLTEHAAGEDRRASKPNAGAGQIESANGAKDACVLPKETLTSKSFASEIRLSSDGHGHVDVTETTLRLGSSEVLERVDVQGMVRVALETHLTPDTKKILRLFNRLQVVDVAAKAIRYTPFKGDIFFVSPNYRRVSGDTHISGQSIDTFTAENLPLSLSPADKIVGSNGRVRFRVTDDNATDLVLVNIPSFITVHSVNHTSPQLLCGMSVYEERVAEVSNNYIVTSMERQNGQYISIYGLEKGILLTTHAISGGVAMTSILPDEMTLVVIDCQMQLHIFMGKDFLAEKGRCALISNMSPLQYNVHEMITFANAPDVLVARCCATSGPDVGSHVYVRVDVTTKRASPALILRSVLLDDVSSDGSTGIDSQLILYDLVGGSVLCSVPYVNRSPHMQIQARISEDKRRIAFINRRDDTVHVMTLAGQTVQPLVSCCAHVPKKQLHGAFSFRYNGTVICLEGGTHPSQMVILLIRECTAGSGMTPENADELTRAISLVSSLQLKALLPTMFVKQPEAVQPTASIIIEDFVDALQIIKQNI